jgi:dynactin-4
MLVDTCSEVLPQILKHPCPRRGLSPFTRLQKVWRHIKHKESNSMSATIPYTYFQCPCTSESPLAARNTGDPAPEKDDESEDDNDFDPRAPRSNYSLYPLEHLLYCEDCQEIRCPKCALDEIVTWFCPNCLFEVPSSTVKSEGNR